MSKNLLVILIVVLIAFLVWWFWLRGNGTTPPIAEPEPEGGEGIYVATSTFVISQHPTNPNKCKIETDTNVSEIYVNPGDTVYFKNDSGTDRTLNFGNARKLFDVHTLTIPAGETGSLVIADDADAKGQGEPHTFRSCHEDIGPPKIIVCPPGTSGPGC